MPGVQSISFVRLSRKADAIYPLSSWWTRVCVHSGYKGHKGNCEEPGLAEVSVPDFCSPEQLKLSWALSLTSSCDVKCAYMSHRYGKRSYVVGGGIGKCPKFPCGLATIFSNTLIPLLRILMWL